MKIRMAGRTGLEPCLRKNCSSNRSFRFIALACSVSWQIHAIDLRRDMPAPACLGLNIARVMAGRTGLEPYLRKNCSSNRSFRFIALACSVSWQIHAIDLRRDMPAPACLSLNIARVMAGRTGLEPATSDVTGRRSNQLNYRPAKLSLKT